MALGYTSQPSLVCPHPSYIIPQFSPIVLLIMYSKITSCSLPIIPVPKPQFCSFCKKYYSTNLSPRNLQLIIIKLWQICKELEYNQNREKFHIHFFKRVISCPSNLHIDGIARHLYTISSLNLWVLYVMLATILRWIFVFHIFDYYFRYILHLGCASTASPYWVALSSQ